MAPINVRIGHGCHCNRPTLQSIRSAGFEVTEVHDDTLKKAPKHVRPLIVGVAQRSAVATRHRAGEAAVVSSALS
jgi:hypothetical protein